MNIKVSQDKQESIGDVLYHTKSKRFGLSETKSNPNPNPDPCVKTPNDNKAIDAQRYVEILNKKFKKNKC